MNKDRLLVNLMEATGRINFPACTKVATDKPLLARRSAGEGEVFINTILPLGPPPSGKEGEAMDAAKAFWWE